jgi:hypothetical protein
MPMLRRSSLRRVAGTLAAFSGVGSAGWRAYSMFKAREYRKATPLPTATPTRIHQWGEWATEIWQKARVDCTLGAIREANNLEAMYPPSDDRTVCVRLAGEGGTVGWCVLFATQMHNSNHFGNLKVGTVLDLQCIPGHEQSAVITARKWLRNENVDLVITNQLHRGWQAAFGASGFIQGPSNYLFAAAPALIRAAGGEVDDLQRAHITRGDGDGRIHL